MLFLGRLFRENFSLGFSWLLWLASNPWHSRLAAALRPVSSRGCLPSVSVSWSKVSSSCENSSCIRFRVPSNPVGPHFFLKIFFLMWTIILSLYWICSNISAAVYVLGVLAVGSFEPQLRMQPQRLHWKWSLNDWTTRKSPWPRLNLLHRQRHYFQIRSHSEVLGHMNFEEYYSIQYMDA